MLSRRKLLSLFGLGGLAAGPLAGAVAFEEVTGKRIGPEKPKPVVKIRANGVDDRDAAVVTTDGRTLWGVFKYNIMFYEHRSDVCVIEFYEVSATGIGIAKADEKLTTWSVRLDRKNSKAWVIDEEGQVVEGVKVVGFAVETCAMVKWSVMCDCEVEWIKHEIPGFVN